MVGVAGLGERSLGYISQMAVRVGDGRLMFTGKGIFEAYRLSRVFRKVVFVGFSSGRRFLGVRVGSRFVVYSIPRFVGEFGRGVIGLLRVVWAGIKHLILVTAYLLAVVLRESLDLLRVENIGLVGFPTFLVSLLTGRRYVLWVGGSEKDVLKLKLRGFPLLDLVLSVFDVMCRMVVRRACHVVTVISGMREYLRRMGARRLLVLGVNFVDTGLFRPGVASGWLLREKGGKKIVLYVGRLEREKGVRELVEAMASVSRVISDVELWVVGDGTLREELREVARRLGVPARFWGTRDMRELPNFYRVADVFVLPSLVEEDAPAALLEAMACGAAVVSTSRLVERGGGCGVLVYRGDLDGLSDAIIRLLRDECLRRELGRRAEEFVGEYASKYFSAMMNVYMGCLGVKRQ